MNDGAAAAVEVTAPPLFIVGAPRSGTSLVRNLIRACEGIYVPPDETQFFPAYLEKVAGGATTGSLASFLGRTAFGMNMRSRGIWPSRPELLEILRDPAPGSGIPALMRYLAGREGRAGFSLWGDKTPRYIYFLDKFRNAFPNMRILFVMRDPRDTVLSMHEAWGRSLVRGAVAWRDAARIAHAGAQMHGPGGAMVVRYEALTAEPAVTMEAIAHWLDVEFSADAIDDHQTDEKWGAVRGTGVTNTSVGRYRTGLTRAEVELVERIAYDEMRLWGYTPDLATESYTPARARLQCARIADGLRSLARYGAERGVLEAVSYKFRQFFVARRSDGG